MKHGSLFSGIGGFDLAAEWMGWENVFHCEINPFGQRVLKYYWPNAISYTDITKTDFTIHRGGIDILTGGFPCQPFSSAGKRKGTADDRHLWPEMLRAVREIQPRYIVGENVRGITNWNGGLVFDQVQVDLEAEGFEVLPFLLPACAVNAPHKRDRIWFVAHQNTKQDGRRDEQRQEESQKRGQRDIGTGDNERLCSDNGKIGSSPDSRQLSEGRPSISREENRRRPSGEPSRPCIKRHTANTNNDSQGWKEEGRCDCKFTRDDWSSWPTVSPVCCGDDGLPRELDGITISKHRKESIMGYGNAVVPNLVHQIFKAIESLSPPIKAS